MEQDGVRLQLPDEVVHSLIAAVPRSILPVVYHRRLRSAQRACRISMDEAIRRIETGDLAPECEKCGGHLKPATISFGQQMPERALARAVELSRSSEVFLSVGSSLVVQPAASLPALAKQAGARLIIINRTPTRWTPLPTWCFGRRLERCCLP